MRYPLIGVDTLALVEVERRLQLGASAYITKPLDVKQFLAAVEGNLDGRLLTNAR